MCYCVNNCEVERENLSFIKMGGVKNGQTNWKSENENRGEGVKGLT